MCCSVHDIIECDSDISGFKGNWCEEEREGLAGPDFLFV
jgi:hypothetical protein